MLECLEATFPSDASLGTTLQPGTTTTSSEQVVTVESSRAWGLRIRSDLDDGRMKEHTGAAYVGTSPRILTSPLMWGLVRIGSTAQTPSYAALSSSQATVVSGQSNTCPLVCGTRQIGVRYRLGVGFGDRRVSPNSYRLLVTYDAAQGF